MALSFCAKIAQQEATLPQNTDPLPSAKPIPFGINFAQPCNDLSQTATTNTQSMSDADTSTYRKDTDDEDT